MYLSNMKDLVNGRKSLFAFVLEAWKNHKHFDYTTKFKLYSTNWCEK